jgi:hypothetical protein
LGYRRVPAATTMLFSPTTIRDTAPALALLTCALLGCGGGSRPEDSREPVAPIPPPAPLAAQKPPEPPPAADPPKEAPPDKASPDFIGFPKPGWSKVSIDDTLPLCVFSSLDERERALFVKGVTRQKLHADASVVFGAFGPGCVNEKCDGLPSLQCRAELADKTITVHAHYFGYRKDGSTCTDDCRRVTAGCETPTLPAGKYKVVYGEKTFDLKIPNVLRSPCLVAD